MKGTTNTHKHYAQPATQHAKPATDPKKPNVKGTKPPLFILF